MFAGAVRHYAEVGLPDSTPTALLAVARIAAQAVTRTVYPTRGPVHINARFRKPLEPAPVGASEPWETLAAARPEADIPVAFPPRLEADGAALTAILDVIGSARRGWLVCGPAPVQQGAAREAILELARRTGFVLLAEATSQVRFGGSRDGVVSCSFFDAVSAVQRAGRRARSGRNRRARSTAHVFGLRGVVANHPTATRIVVAPNGWNDPRGDARMLVLSDPSTVVAQLVSRLPSPRPATPWALDFVRADACAATVIGNVIDPSSLSEATIARTLVACCPETAVLMVGNSLPVRDLDAYCPASSRKLAILHQRGASGIDGLIAGASGAASVWDGPVALLLGDVSFLHDVGSLHVARAVRQTLVVVVVDNGGGRIFDHLPIARAWDAQLFERYFATPPNLDVQRVASAFDIPATRATTEAELGAAVLRAFASPGPTVVHAVAAPRRGAQLSARIHDELCAKLAAVFG